MRILFLSDRAPGQSPRADAYCTRIDGLRRALAAQGAETGLLSLRTLRFSRPHLLFPLNAPALGRRARGYDVIHAAGAGATVAAISAKRWHGRPVIFDVHGDELLETRLMFRARPGPRTAFHVLQSALLTGIAQRRADLLLAVSEPFRQRYIGKGVPAERLSVVRNGADVAAFQPGAATTDGLLRFCYAGGFQAWQAMHLLIDAFASVTAGAKGSHLRLMLIGFSADDQALKGQIAARLGDRAILEDWMPPEALPARLARTDVLVIPRTDHPAMRGGCPSKFAEFLAMGRPLIVTDVDEASQFVAAHACGAICQPTAESLAEALRCAAAWSAEARAGMGANARRLAEAVFDWRVIAGEYLSRLQAITHGWPQIGTQQHDRRSTAAD